MNHLERDQNQPDLEKESLPSESEVIISRENKSWVERVLSPQSLQIMMASGGGILVIGLAIWLWSIGLFDNPFHVALGMGIGNLGLLGCGLWLGKATRYKTAARGLTLLSSLALPLHLWFYHAQDLISLDNGGHLWIPALVISGLYAVTARITRDSMFVYTLVGGIVLTGLLFLANPAIGSLWAILPTSAFLIVLGLICTGADRVFEEGQGAFSRNEFGLAFFKAGQIVLAAGLATIGVGEILGMDSSLLTTNGQVWTIGILMMAICNYAYAHVVRPFGSVFPLLIGGLSFWAGLIGLYMLEISITYNLFMLAVATALLVANLWYQRVIVGAKKHQLSRVDRHVIRTALPLASTAVFLLGLAQFFLGLVFGFGNPGRWFFEYFGGQLVITGLAVWATPGASVLDKAPKAIFRGSTLGIAGGSSMFAMAVMTYLVPSYLVGLVAAFAMPTALIVMAVSTGNRVDKHRLGLAVASTTGFIVVTALLEMGRSLLGFAEWPSIGLMAVATGYLVFAERTTRAGLAALAATGAGIVLVAQLVVLFNLNSAYSLIIGLSCLGMLVLVVAKVVSVVATDSAEVGSTKESTSSLSLELAANVLLLAGAASTVLFVGSSLLASSIVPAHIGLIAFQMIPIFAGWFVNQDVAWKRTFVTAGIVTLLAGAIALASVSTLSITQRVELVSLIVGAILVVCGYVGWSMEKDEKADLVSFQLIFGSLCLAVPMILGIAAYRVFGVETVNHAWRQLHEIGGLVIGLSLLGSGVLSRVRSTTLSGAAILTTYVGSIVWLIQWPEQLQSVSFLMMIGGGAFFTVAILLSIYRDRLLELPERIRSGRGVFRVLKWR